VGIAETIVDSLSKQFVGDPGFRIFHVDSEHEMREAYNLISELEESPQFTSEEREFITELRWLIAIVLVLTAALLFWVTETAFYHSRISDQGV
jgi:hypothetical protein